MEYKAKTLNLVPVNNSDLKVDLTPSVFTIIIFFHCSFRSLVYIRSIMW